MQVQGNIELNDNRVLDFFLFVCKRQQVWYRKEVCGYYPPWTDDPVLQKYHFCNVYRELDKGTMYLIERLGEEDLNRKDLLVNVVIYRFFNRYRFFDEILEPVSVKNWNVNEIIDHLDKVKEKGVSLFNVAYTVCQNHFWKNARRDKHVQVMLHVNWLVKNLGKIMKKLDSASNPKDQLYTLTKIPAVAGFLGYEIWTDLTYFDFFKQGWTDNDLANLGPGAWWGLNILCSPDDLDIGNDKLKEPLFSLEDYENMAYLLRDYQDSFFELVREKYGIDWLAIHYPEAFSNVPYLSLRNIEHSLCEYRKYVRMNLGRGRKRYYRFND